MSPADREAIRAALQTKRDGLVRARKDVVEAAIHQGDSLADPMDAATRATEEAELLGLASHERVLIREIDRALAKIASGTYGVSELSGEPIPIERLRAVPWARLTAEEEERRERQTR